MRKIKNSFIGGAALVLVFAGVGCAAENPAPAEKPAAPVLVTVDPRVELMSLIFRLAGNREYGTCAIPSYNNDVNEHFGPFKDHPAVKLAAELRKTRGVSYDAVMKMAVHMTDTVTFGERIPFSPQPASLDERWPAKDAREFLSLARKFAEETKFNEFYEKHQPLYRLAERRMQEVLDKNTRLDWFEGFFGPRKDADFHVILGMLNAGGSYGARLTSGGREDLYCVLGVWKVDKQGEPVFTAGLASTVVHEFTHSYTNPLVDKFARELEASGKKLYPLVADQMEQQAYGNWKTMMYESLNRACGLRYQLATGGDGALKSTADYEISRGFYWVPGLADVLARYEARPRKYADLAQFFPEITAYFDDYAKNSGAKLKELEEKRLAEAEQRKKLMQEWREKGPRIVSIVPADGATVDPGLKAITVTFDRPMKQGWSVLDIGPGEYPKIGEPVGYDAGLKVFTMPIELKPGRNYSFGLNNGQYTSFKSAEGVPLYPVEVSFKTRKP